MDAPTEKNDSAFKVPNSLALAAQRKKASTSRNAEAAATDAAARVAKTNNDVICIEDDEDEGCHSTASSMENLANMLPTTDNQDSELLLAAPYFKLENNEAPQMSASVAAKCMSCGIMCHGQKHNLRAFRNHLMVQHYNLYGIYLECRNLLNENATQQEAIAENDEAAATANNNDAGVGDATANNNDAVAAAATANNNDAGAAADSNIDAISATTDAAAGSANKNVAQGDMEVDDDSDVILIPEATEDVIIINDDDGPPPPSELPPVCPNEILEPPPVGPSEFLEPPPVPPRRSMRLKRPADNELDDANVSFATIRSFARLLDTKTCTFVTRSEMEQQETHLREFLEGLVTGRLEDSRSLSTSNDSLASEKSINSQLQNVNKEVASLKTEVLQLRTALRRSQHANKRLKSELHLVDKQVRQRYVVIRNVNMNNFDHPKALAEWIVANVLEINDMPVIDAHLLTKFDENTRNNLHMLRVEFAHESHVQEVFQNGHKLRNSGMFLEKELGPFARQRKYKLLTLKKELQRRSSSVSVHVNNDMLYVQGQPFYWDDDEGLCVGREIQNVLNSNTQNNRQLTSDDASYMLEELTGVQIKDFIEVLNRYELI